MELKTIPDFIELNNEQLQLITSRCIKNRVKSECAELYKNYHNVLIDVIDKTITITAMEFIVTNNNNITTTKRRVYKFILKNNEYPFRPPEIYINNDPYSNMLQTKGEYEKEMLKKIKGQNCLCCYSFNCSANWSPAIKLYRIIDEIKDTLKFKRDIINLILVEKIKKQYNIPYAYIDKYLI